MSHRPARPQPLPADYRFGYRPNRGQPNPLPQLTIKGRWLEQLGFTSGQKIEVITWPGQLLIRLANEG
ncbi:MULTISPECIES: SymE family type I addiction module toxin [Pantoea]|uniref:SymE family type I addiction module toxin n=1 Tax=Pantoea TaxID=53335 RepID=UPI000CE3C05B|nr:MULTISPECIES: SymE family type I addiction module toxin [Pantoea]KAF0856309.1 hypothetical protein Y788_07385 [Pantoea dispersa 625]MBS0896318.1 type I toxin-antitoxin system SymE family toxin [Pantoea dispersa]MBS0905683.1 type I toxin-antitoxin system SymE family toxin [Pantoea dispersa]MCI1027721.1 type I toxin-antitoxin system SymE family toxin [Pantoea dispersa]MCW0321558.1 hypothetical protein [Pantoea dispersa]